ncbi:MAG TPA: hypothetical protein VM055_02795 [Novosphingobium sp.]|nr:hypothetical protein [Novosphingobium sp.]
MRKSPRSSEIAEFFDERRARADVGAALEIMSRKRGEKPRKGDQP